MHRSPSGALRRPVRRDASGACPCCSYQDYATRQFPAAPIIPVRQGDHRRRALAVPSPDPSLPIRVGGSLMARGRSRTNEDALPPGLVSGVPQSHRTDATRLDGPPRILPLGGCGALSPSPQSIQDQLRSQRRERRPCLAAPEARCSKPRGLCRETAYVRLFRGNRLHCRVRPSAMLTDSDRTGYDECPQGPHLAIDSRRIGGNASETRVPHG